MTIIKMRTTNQIIETAQTNFEIQFQANNKTIMSHTKCIQPHKVEQILIKNHIKHNLDKNKDLLILKQSKAKPILTIIQMGQMMIILQKTILNKNSKITKTNTLMMKKSQSQSLIIMQIFEGNWQK